MTTCTDENASSNSGTVKRIIGVASPQGTGFSPRDYTTYQNSWGAH